MRSSPLTDADRALIRDLHERVGWKPQRIADVMGTGLTAIYRALNSDKRRSGAELVEDALWLLDSGEHPSHVAQRLGVTAWTLEKALSRHGHPRPDVTAEAIRQRRLRDRRRAA
ncbi:hypothetical protein [Tessaracoccus massiliensis]|uniref:hypothetical protein n=1 Tax=Tessaracoccus massiliensis TaxID=1522311 RepID=UPI00058F8769|nr:hypothetical protein [Tessaracoccus massiliensis]